MTLPDGSPRNGWSGLRLAPRPHHDPFAAWYEAWRAQQAANRAAEEHERARMRREIRWMSGLIAAWSLVMGGAAAFAIWLVL